MAEPRVDNDAPPYWNEEIYALVQRRAAMPDVQRWQSTYVRYHGQPEGQVTQTGWELASSQVGNGTGVPVGIQMRITAAPAEFVVPVKQDRRLTPDFKLRVDVRYRGRVSFPLTIRAHILSQQEKDNLPEWRPEGMLDCDAQGVRNGGGFAHLAGSHGGSVTSVERKIPTELKGTTYITHHFESSMETLSYSKHDAMGSYGGVLPSSLVGGNAVPPHFMPSMPHVVPSTVIQTPMTAALPNQAYLAGQDGTLIQGLRSDQLYQQPGYYGDEVNVFQYGNQVHGASSDFPEAMGFSHMFQDIIDTSDPTHLPQSFDRQPSLGIKTEHFARDFPCAIEHKPCVEDLISSSDETVVHEFEFANLEFLKPTRMSKVYICFACTIMDCDLLYCVYHIPTVGICRAEQRIKASDKLGIPTRSLESEGLGHATDHTRSESSVHYRPGSAKRHHDNDSLDMMRDALAEMEDSESRVDGSEPEVSFPYSRQALRDWITEEYDGTGLKRRLTELDLQTLESQAGFPVGGGAAGITQNQWNEFTSQFHDILALLKLIASVWNTEDPCVISGLHLDRRATVQALMHEPAGTFVCRLSLSMPGTLVLSCKVRPDVERADSDGLIHAIIRMDDLQERRVDTWIRDFPSGSHVLDVYTQKRVDKRKVFHAMYMRMKHMEDMFHASVGPHE